MAIYLGGEIKHSTEKRNLDDLTPRQIVEELDKYVVGQNGAKKAVAVALSGILSFLGSTTCIRKRSFTYLLRCVLNMCTRLEKPLAPS